MSPFIWGGRCEDCCCMPDKLMMCTDKITPHCKSAWLCAACIRQRQEMLERNEPLPDIGLLPRGEWQILKSLTLILGQERITVEIRLLSINKCGGGIARLRFDGDKKWLLAGTFTNVNNAHLDVQRFLRAYYFRGLYIRFE